MKRFSPLKVAADIFIKLGVYETAHRLRFKIWEPLFQAKRAAFGLETAGLSFFDSHLGFPLVTSYSKWWFGKSKENHERWHEPSVSGFIMAARAHNPVMLDVGAHLGYFSMIHASAKGNTAYAIELSPKNFSILEKSLPNVTGMAGDVHVLNLGISRAASFVMVKNEHRPSPGINLETISSKSSDSGTHEKISIESLDQFCESRSIIPDIIKVDIEGSEFDFFVGGEAILKKRRPVLVMEVHRDKVKAISGASIDDLFALGESYGYTIYKFTDHRSDKPMLLAPLQKNGSWPVNFDVVFVSTADRPLIEDYNMWCEKALQA